MDREIAAIMREDEAVRAFAWDNGTWVRTEQLQAPSGRTDMRLVLCGALLALISSVADAADAPVAICSPDPNHLWNRLYHAMAIRTLDGVQYGADIAEPYPDDFDGRKRLISTLDEFVRTQGERSLPGETRRALMLNDVWTAFDISTVHGGIELRSRIARAIERLRMPTSDVARLKDNYAEAVKSGKFPKDFDPAHPDIAYEFVMRRRELIAGMGGGLHPVSPDEREYQALLVPHEKGNASYFTGPVVLRTCAGCHRAKGIFSVGSYLGMFDHNPTNPQLLPASQPEDQGVATARWKKAQFNWGLLEGLLQAERSR